MRRVRELEKIEDDMGETSANDVNASKMKIEISNEIHNVNSR